MSHLSMHMADLSVRPSRGFGARGLASSFQFNVTARETPSVAKMNPN